MTKLLHDSKYGKQLALPGVHFFSGAFFSTTFVSTVFVSASLLFGLLGVVLAPQALALTVTPKLELTANPGENVHTEIKVTNESRESHTFYLRSENFNAQDETGNPSFNLRREGLSTWIQSPPSITLGPGESIILPVEIAVPFNADPGGHYAAVFFLTHPPDPTDDSGAVAVSAKLGSLILLRVNGDFVQDANILEFGTTNKQRIFSQLPIQFYYRFQNTGEDHLKPVGDIQINNLIGRTTKILPANTVDGSVLPKSVRKFFSVWTERAGELKQAAVIDLPKSEPLSFWGAVSYQAHNFAFGRYTADLKVAFGTKELKSDSAQFTFYIIPWQLLVIVIPSIIIFLIFLRWLIKRYNRYIIFKDRQAKSR